MVRATREAPIGLAALALLMTGCAAPEGAAPSDSRTPSQTQTPPSSVVHSLDLGNATWEYSPGGFAAPVSLDFVDGAASDGMIEYTLGDPVFGDVNDDGFDDALLPITSLDGNGTETLWYIIVGDDTAVWQVPAPVARASRCGDNVTATSWSDGAFVVEAQLRLREDSGLSCADPGTGEIRRAVKIDGVPGDGRDVFWPVQVLPIPAWGGICPGTDWWDTEPSFIELLSAPDQDGPVAVPADAESGVYPALQEPWEVLPPNADVRADQWAFVVFTSGTLPDAERVRTHCAWAQRT